MRTSYGLRALQTSKARQDQLQQLALLADENRHLAVEKKRLLDVVKTLEEQLEGEREDAKRQRRHMERLGTEKQKLSEQLAKAKDELANVVSALKVAVNEWNELATEKMFAREATAILEKEHDEAPTELERLEEEIQLIQENFCNLKLREGVKPLVDYLVPEPPKEGPLYLDEMPPPSDSSLERCKTVYLHAKDFKEFVRCVASFGASQTCLEKQVHVLEKNFGVNLGIQLWRNIDGEKRSGETSEEKNVMEIS